MKYYDSDKNKYVELFLTDADKSVQAEVERIYSERPTDDINELANKVQDYYYHKVGVGSNRLWSVIDYYCEELIANRERNNEQ